MKYLILIYRNPSTRKIWEEGFTDADRAAAYRAYAELNDSLTASGELIVSESLMDVEETRHVIVREGRALASDGPFAEVKELLAGFYLVEADSMDRAVEIAAAIPEVAVGAAEIRPVRELP